MARALAAAIAVSFLVVAGAGGAPAQTPKRGGTLVFRMIGPEPACLNILSGPCLGPPTLFAILDAVLAKPFAVGPDFGYRPRLATATFTRKRPFTLTYRIHPDARWSDGQPVTARDFLFTHRVIRAHGWPGLREVHRVVRSTRVVDAKTVKVVLQPRSSSWRELFGNVLPEHALRGADLTRVCGSRASTTRGRGGRSGAGPF